MNIEKFEKIIENIADMVWGFPMIVILLGGCLFFTIQLRMLPFRHAYVIYKETVGQLFHGKKKKSGSLSPFQAFSTSLASTAGASNIIGVPVAIAFGGPGAMFWMWVIALIGMSLIYAEIVLGLRYREKLEDEWVGGPLFYMRKALNWRYISLVYVVGMLFEVFTSSMVQANAAAEVVQQSFQMNSRVFVGLGLMLAVGLVVFGGVKRIGKVMEKLLPLLVVLYVVLCGIIIWQYIDHLGEVFTMIFTKAFSATAPIGVFAGAGLVQAMRWGFARGLYTSEVGMGNAAIANASSKVDHPAQQGFWGIFGVFIDTIVICSFSGLAVLISGVWKTTQADLATEMIIKAFDHTFGQTISAWVLSIVISLFVLATIGVIIYYGEKQVQYLFNKKWAMVYRLLCIGAIFLGSIGALAFLWRLVDLILVFVVVPNLVAILLLRKDVKTETDLYFNCRKINEKFKKS